MKDKLAFGVLVALTAGTQFLVPGWQRFWTDPCMWANVGAILTVVVLLVTRHLGDRARLFEVRWFALFLAAMPTIYVARLVLQGHASNHGWLLVETMGLLFYVSLAVLGLKNHWLLVVGIAAHGIAWDAWHWYPPSAYMPSWYAILCLADDVGLALYAAARIPAWRRAENRMRGLGPLNENPQDRRVLANSGKLS